MTPVRRSLLGAALAAAAWPQSARAQPAADFPAKALQMVVPFPPGGVADLLARAIASGMAADLRQPVVVDNRPGAGGNIGAAAVAKAAPDGHTLLYAVGSILTANPHLYPSVGFDAFKDFAPIGETVAGGMVLLVRRDLPVDTLPQLLAHLKANPGRLNYASYGNGSFPHLNMELLKSKAGVHVVHIPYRGAAPALADLLAGQVDLMFDVSTTALPQVRAGRVKPIAVNTPQRLDALPAVPTLSETFAGFDGSGWQGVFVPAGTPAPVQARLAAALGRAMADPALRTRIVESGLIVKGGSAADLATKMRGESARWADVVRFAKIRVD